MITREDYNIALTLVEDYHKQLKADISKPKLKSLFELEIGDFVVCRMVHPQGKSCLTIGKEYEVVEINPWNRVKMFFIVDDNGNKKKYNCTNRQFRAINT